MIRNLFNSVTHSPHWIAAGEEGGADRADFSGADFPEDAEDFELAVGGLLALGAGHWD